MFTDAPGDTPLPPHKTKVVPLDQYVDFYDFMFKDRLRKQFTFGKVQYVPRNTEAETTPLVTRTVNHDEFFEWYDEQFTHGHRQNLDQITPHPLFATFDGKFLNLV